MSNLFDGFAQWLLGLVTAVLTFVVDAVEFVLVAILNLLPAMPPLPTAVAQFSGWVNYLLPMSEVATLLTAYAAIVAGLYVYKLIKLIRGAG